MKLLLIFLSSAYIARDSVYMKRECLFCGVIGCSVFVGDSSWLLEVFFMFLGMLTSFFRCQKWFPLFYSHMLHVLLLVLVFVGKSLYSYNLYTLREARVSPE